jgi:RHS repeat-associated protein
VDPKNVFQHYRYEPYLLTHRYLDPSPGKFASRDPIGTQGGENLYNAFGGNPVNRIAPNGTTDNAIFDRAKGTLSIWDDERPKDRIEIRDVAGNASKALSQAVFSGEPPYLNDPTKENVKRVGPIPKGQYVIGPETYNATMHSHFQLFSKATDWTYLGNR